MNINSQAEDFIGIYLYPLLLADNLETFIVHMTYGTVIYGICTLLIPFPAPYGRHSRKWAGFGIPSKLAWVLQEMPSFVIPVALALYGNKNNSFNSITSKICIGMYIIHYFQRSFIYPALLKSKQPTPFVPFFFAFLTTSYNGILHGLYFVSYQQYKDSEWLVKPYFWIGISLFLCGMNINILSDSKLRNLRKGQSNEYIIPTGGMFNYVSCANYFGEIVEMWGYALASCAPPAFAFAFFTTIFLTRRGVQNHEWYLKKFEDYPRNRKAVIPYII